MDTLTASSQIAFVLVNHQGGEHTIERLRHNRAVADPDGRAQWIVVDNASTDGSLQALQREPDLWLEALPTNRGFAAGVNHAMRLVQRPFALLVNPDLELRPGTPARLLETMLTDRSIAVCGPQLTFPDGSLQESAFRFPTPLSRVFRLMGGKSITRRLGILRAGRVQPRTLGTTDVDAVKGACFLLRMDAWRRIGMFDEDYFLYHEELDWCLRARQHGWRCVLDTAALAVHEGWHEEDPAHAERYLHRHRGLLHYFAKHHGGFGNQLVRAFTRVHLWSRRAANVIAPQPREEKRKRQETLERASSLLRRS